MIRILVILTSLLSLSSCATDYDSLGVDILNEGKITYLYKVDKKISMQMKLKFEVTANSRFKIKLDAKDDDSKDAIVEIIAVSGELPNGGDTSIEWLNGSGSYNSTNNQDNFIIFDVPDVPSGTSYKFDITVAGIGTIDPRVDVN